MTTNGRQRGARQNALSLGRFISAQGKEAIGNASAIIKGGFALLNKKRDKFLHDMQVGKKRLKGSFRASLPGMVWNCRKDLRAYSGQGTTEYAILVGVFVVDSMPIVFFFAPGFYICLWPYASGVDRVWSIACIMDIIAIFAHEVTSASVLVCSVTLLPRTVAIFWAIVVVADTLCFVDLPPTISSMSYREPSTSLRAQLFRPD